ncbi:chemoreceptor glutamine deamidase CheD [bacterium]|nr:chemoreceptor glutamine deamidase CheD [bacterium]
MNTQPAKGIAPCLPQFNGIKRYASKAYGVESVAKIMPGEYYVSYRNEMIMTVLGSCISVCVYDEAAQVGGMNHFMLPDKNSRASSNCDLSQSAIYGNYAMEKLINDVMFNGGKRDRLRFKLFGGASLMGASSVVGEQNVQFVKHYLRAEGFRWCAEDLGKGHPRWVKFFPMSGKVQLKYLPVEESQHIVEEESQAKKTVDNTAPDGGDLELF